MGFTASSRHLIGPVLLLLIAAPAIFASNGASVRVTIEKTSNLGVIKGIVRDQTGTPIGDAVVGIFKGGTTSLLKQVTSGTDGYFLAKVLPGKYTVLAVAQGFNPVRILGVEVGRASEVTYGFNLERAGSGNTLPEKRGDKNSSKWRLRAAQMQRSIYQNREGKDPITADETTATDLDAATEKERVGRGQTVVDTYFAGSSAGSYAGLNFATLLPVTSDAEIVFAGQTGLGKNAPQRFETGVRYRPSADHQLRFTGSIAKLGNLAGPDHDRSFGQVSMQATDEWKLKEGVILVFGFDYSRFFGAGNDMSISPRLGLQFDVDNKTRFRTAFTTQTEEKSWANAIELEGESFAFTEPQAIEDIYVVGGKPRMNKARRLEFGVERLLDGRSSVEANVFVDTSMARGVGLNRLSFDTLDGSGFDHIVADQQGRTMGLRVVYTRRVTDALSTTAGYSFGRGQKLSPSAIKDPNSIFENDFFRSFFAQVAADLKTGTTVRTVFRLSPDATVFAIDPFRGRLAIYDPGLSVYLTQTLPTWGLPIRAQAVVDARNVLDMQNGIFGEDGSVKFSAQRRLLRGGLQVRF
jgi:hypothetical protein